MNETKEQTKTFMRNNNAISRILKSFELFDVSQLYSIASESHPVHGIERHTLCFTLVIMTVYVVGVY